MLTLDVLIAWLATLGVLNSSGSPLLFVPGTKIPPKMPDELCRVTPVSGPGEQMEGLADVVGFQLRWRGRQRGADSVGRVARKTDQKVRFSGFPFVLSTPDGDVHVVAIERAGSPPSLLSGTPDPATERSEYVCNYNFTVMEVLP